MSSTSSINALHLSDDVMLYLFNQVPVNKYYQLGLVCKKWNEILEKNPLWMPIYKELSLHAYEQVRNNTQSFQFKQLVNVFVKENQNAVDQIIHLIDDNSKLPFLFGCQNMTLADLKKKSCLERSLIVMGALSKDATPIYKYINEKGVREFLDLYRFLPIKCRDSFQNKYVKKFLEKKICLPLLCTLIEKDAGPFDAEEILVRLLPCSCAQPYMHKILAKIVKSHYKMPEFFSHSMVIYSQIGVVGPISVMKIVGWLMPMMKIKHDVTEEDWIQCGYIPK